MREPAARQGESQDLPQESAADNGSKALEREMIRVATVSFNEQVSMRSHSLSGFNLSQEMPQFSNAHSQVTSEENTATMPQSAVAQRAPEDMAAQPKPAAKKSARRLPGRAGPPRNRARGSVASPVRKSAAPVSIEPPQKKGSAA